MIDHLSVSQITMFLRCGAQYEFRYLKGIKLPPAGAMIQGTAYHAAIATDLSHKQDTGELLLDNEIDDIFSTSFDYQIKSKGTQYEDDSEQFIFEDIDWQGEEPGKVKDDGIRLAKLYHNTMASKINPIEVEERKEGIVAGIPFVLIADVVEENKIIDHKLKKKRYSEDELKKDLQATAYSWIYDKPFEFHQALKLKVPIIEIAQAPRNKSDYLFFQDLVYKVKQAIDTGIFYPNPTTWACGKLYCGYWQLCKGSGK